MRVIDTFAGCGGFTKGFEDAGSEIIAAFEYWDAAIKCYEKNFKHPIIKHDLSRVAESIKKLSDFEPDMIIGGPPCQDFSHAGKRREGERANLTEAFAEIVRGVRPRYFIMENVDISRKSRAWSNARDIIKEAGYGITEKVLNASFCGVPQRRKRFFCAGAREEDDGFLDPYFTSRLSRKEQTIRGYLNDELGVDFYYRHPRNYNRRGIFSIDEPSPTVRGVNRPIPKGYPGHHNDPAPKDTPGLRPLTTLERARIQTFPKNFTWIGAKTDLEQMIGNAVPVKLAEFVAKAFFEYQEGRQREILVKAV